MRANRVPMGRPRLVCQTPAPPLLRSPHATPPKTLTVPQMPLMLHEHFTVKLLDMLRSGEIDCAILAEPFPDAGLAIAPLYDEPFFAAVPRDHAIDDCRRVPRHRGVCDDLIPGIVEREQLVAEIGRHIPAFQRFQPVGQSARSHADPP